MSNVFLHPQFGSDLRFTKSVKIPTIASYIDMYKDLHGCTHPDTHFLSIPIPSKKSISTSCYVCSISSCHTFEEINNWLEADTSGIMRECQQQGKINDYWGPSIIWEHLKLLKMNDFIDKANEKPPVATPTTDDFTAMYRDEFLCNHQIYVNSYSTNMTGGCKHCEAHMSRSHNEINAWLNKHTHPTGLGPSSPFPDDTRKQSYKPTTKTLVPKTEKVGKVIWNKKGYAETVYRDVPVTMPVEYSGWVIKVKESLAVDGWKVIPSGGDTLCGESKAMITERNQESAVSKVESHDARQKVSLMDMYDFLEDA